MAQYIDITGLRFGRLIVVRRIDNVINGRARFECLCDCGKQAFVPGKDLRSGNTRSCGCYGRERLGLNARKHGYSHAMSKTYLSWKEMRRRCNDPRRKQYEDYGGRGIRVCSRWDDFANFLADMGEAPIGLTLDRIDNEKGYERTNCRWTTREEQNNNRRHRRGALVRLAANQVQSIRADHRSMHAIARAYGISATTVFRIIHRITWRDI